MNNFYKMTTKVKPFINETYKIKAQTSIPSKRSDINQSKIDNFVDS